VLFRSGFDVTIEEVTSAFAQLNLQGPLSRQVLAALTSTSLDTADFPFRTARWMTVAGVDVLCARITYLGELGYELYIPVPSETPPTDGAPGARADGAPGALADPAPALAVWDAIMAAGEPFGIVPVGLAALASLRMEKAYRDFGHDIDNTDCPLEVGLGFAVALDSPDKPGGFLGRDAVLARRAGHQARGGMTRRLVLVRLNEAEPLLFGAEVVYRDGVAVGYLRAASYGWTLGASVGLAMVSAAVPPDGPVTRTGPASPPGPVTLDGPVTSAGIVTPEWLAEGHWEVDIAGVRYAAEVSLRPMYDPTSAKVRA
jgi:4-methylaminobutanoate oxidase (formaldehyde-forming)